jgi:N6-adenosine-specific RNA methylase IME4
MTRYRTIVADPPWQYAVDGKHLRSSTAHRPNRSGATLLGAGSAQRYGSMPMADLKAIVIPAEDDAHLYVWATNAFMVEAHDLAVAWGFDPKTILTWIKPQIGLGHYFRNTTEHVVFAVRGSLKPLSRDARTDFTAPRTQHSAKPDCFYDMVERVSPGPYLELFARRARFGWDYWGDQSLGTAEVAA